MRTTLLIVAAFGCMAAACDRPGAPAEARKTASAVHADYPTNANAECKLFSPAEIAGYIGEPVLAGQNVAGGCQWLAKDGSGDVIVAAILPVHHEPPKLAGGCQPLAAPGADGFTAPYLGGWIAGAIVSDRALRVSVDGQAASRASALALLTDAAKRLSS